MKTLKNNFVIKNNFIQTDNHEFRPNKNSFYNQFLGEKKKKSYWFMFGFWVMDNEIGFVGHE